MSPWLITSSAEKKPIKKTKEQKHTHLDERIFNETPHANAT